MDRADPPKRRFRWRILLGMALVGALVLALTVDFGKLRRTLTMLTSIELGQVLEILEGVGEVGVLAQQS